MTMFRYRYTVTGAAGGPYLSIFHFLVAAPTQATADAGGAKIKTAFGFMLGTWDTGITGALQTNVDQIDEATGDLTGQFTTTTANQVGTITPGVRLPPSNQALFRWQTNSFVGGRRIRGRTFFPAQLESNNVDPGVPGGSLLLSGPANFIGSLIAAGDPNFCVWHRPKGAVAGSAHVVSGGALAPYWAVLRSRRD